MPLCINVSDKEVIMERKTVKFEVKDVDEEAGTFEGYAATFSKRPDSYGDIIEPGAFAKTLKEAGKRVKILWNHHVLEPIGKPTEMAEDDKGLLVKGKLSLGVQRAREVLSLMKDGVITEMSIGYDTLKESWQNGIRHLQEVRLWDVSPVTFAANPDAVIVSVKKATTFGDLPLADRDREWSGSGAERRVRAWAGGEDNMNWNKYRQAFFWYDEDSPELFGSYKLGFADIIDNRLTTIPRGVFAVAAVIMGARGGVDIPEDDMAGVKSHVEKYYAKMRKEFDDDELIAPWNKSTEGATEPTGEKTGRVLSAASLEQIQAALSALQALLDAAAGEEEPEKSTQLSEVAEEAAELEIVVKALKAENDGFDTKEAEGRIEAILAQLKVNTEVNSQ